MKIVDWIYGHKDELISDLAELVAVPSVMGESSDGAPFGEEPKNALLLMLDKCEKSGFITRNFENAIGFAQLGEGEPELGILCHLDVVPALGAGWKSCPFHLTEKNGVLYGRGAIDDKGPAAAVLYALKCVKELGLPLKKSVRVIFGTNEENGSDDLKIYKKYEKFPPKVFTPDGSFPVINIEKGMLRSTFSGKISAGSRLLSFSGGAIPNAVPDYAECTLRGVFEDDFKNAVKELDSPAVFECEAADGLLKIRCGGRSAHASTPETGINAVTALISLVNRLIDEPIFEGLEKIFPFGETNGASAGLDCSDEESGALTCVFSVLNVENGEASGIVDVRFPCLKKLHEIENAEKAAFASAGLEFSGKMGDEPHIVPSDSEFVKTLLRVYERVEGEKGFCVAIGGGTYVHNIDGGVAFGAERGDTDYNMHGDNEFITTSELLKDAILFAEVICEVCG